MQKTTVERSLWIAATRERVWQAISEPEQVAQWLMPPAMGAQLERSDDGKLFVAMGPMKVEIALMEIEDPPRQLTTRSMPDGLIATTYTLEPEKDGTRVTVTVSGFQAFPPDTIKERLTPTGMGWEKALENLKAYIENKPLPFPQGFVSAMFGFRREAPKKIEVERSIWIAASRERVWEAITDPKQVQQWFSPGTEWRGTGVKVGGRLSVYNAETNTDMYTQVIEVVDPPIQLVTRNEPTPPEPPYVTDWTLREENGGTRLTITYSGYELDTEDARHDKMEQNAFGFGMMLENLKASIEGAPLPYPGGF